MNTVGIISEYNPFHNGHLHHLNEIKSLFNQDVRIICLLSSNYVQRGEPALVDKYTRADMAISNGADMVLEYPALFCCTSAEAYADNAVYILNNIGIIDYISYGSKSFDNDSVRKISAILANETKDYKVLLKNELSKGLSFPKAREKALSRFFLRTQDESELITKTLKSSNDILAIEYEKALLRQKSSIITIPVERIGSDYNDPDLKECYSSATAIRKSILSTPESVSFIKSNVPYATLEILKEYSKNMSYGSINIFEDIIFYSLISKKDCDIKKYPLVNEGIENLLKRTINSSRSIEEFIQSCTTKRYPSTRIQRLLIHIMLGADKDIYGLFKRPEYVRVLACKDKSLLSHISVNSKLPIITSLKKSYNNADQKIRTLIEFENKACDIYNMICLKDKCQYTNEFSVKPKI